MKKQEIFMWGKSRFFKPNCGVKVVFLWGKSRFLRKTPYITNYLVLLLFSLSDEKGCLRSILTGILWKTLGGTESTRGKKFDAKTKNKTKPMVRQKGGCARNLPK